MSKISEYYGLKMVGIKKVSGMTKELTPSGDPYVEIHYDTVTGEVLGRWHGTRNEFTRYHDENVVFVCATDRPLTMRDVACDVYATMCVIEYHKKEAER